MAAGDRRLSGYWEPLDSGHKTQHFPVLECQVRIRIKTEKAGLGNARFLVGVGGSLWYRDEDRVGGQGVRERNWSFLPANRSPRCGIWWLGEFLLLCGCWSHFCQGSLPHNAGNNKTMKFCFTSALVWLFREQRGFRNHACVCWTAGESRSAAESCQRAAT